MISLGNGFYYTLISKEYKIKAIYNSNNKTVRFVKDGEIIQQTDVSSFSAVELIKYLRGVKEGLLTEKK